MKKLLNTLFVTTENAYSTLEGENIVVKVDDSTLGRFPLHILENIYLYTYAGASPALMGKCAKENINLVFFSPKGRFLARTVGKSNGNVLLRREQYRIADDTEKSCKISKNFIFGKIYNCRKSINRTKRDHPLSINQELFESSSDSLKELLPVVLNVKSNDTLRGFEGIAAEVYFQCLDDMILRHKIDFYFQNRNRRPPLDNVNALLSMVYTYLCNDCASALEAVGLDSFVGFLHRDRPGRTSLALDLMEEFRPCMADRFVLTMINDRVITPDDFEKTESGAVNITNDGRHSFQKAWQEKKKTTIEHPYLKEKVEWGLLPYVQAILLARYIRGDIEEYPPFLWK